MLKYVSRRFLAMVMTLWIIITATFFLMHSVPGSPLNGEHNTSEAVQANLEAYYGLDRPVLLQYVDYLGSIIQFDFGPSISQPAVSVNDLISRGFPVSLELGLYALGFALISGVTLGVLAALRRNGMIDYLLMTLAVLGLSVPNFILAALLIQSFKDYLPVALWHDWTHMILPVFALATSPMAIIARLTRSTMVDVLTQDYIRTAQAKGLSPFVVVTKHALRNGLMPVVTIMGTLVAGVLTGSFVIEKIFAIPGIGRYFVEGINNRDYAVIMGTTIFYSAILLVMLLIVDIIYGFLDPRIRLDKKEAK
ncbi:ABC transporter permease [Shouchella sp. JSM 1781072]|uniref:ABC transporter permease n=1 Tax=Bacillaceae TaxID=186817 RepID=UPI000C07A1F4|nr:MULTISPECIES: ABC transporter permease [Bacillaceae]UTR05759.1 ABC transporter permease [Alkalihalobacillus sp. LMS6]